MAALEPGTACLVRGKPATIIARRPRAPGAYWYRVRFASGATAYVRPEAVTTEGVLL